MESNKKLMVSVCVMTYNLEKYIAQALDSILMQKVNFKYNIVVGEDCSTDNTRQILQDYANKYPDKFTLLFHESNLGMVSNFIETLKECHGKYIALLDGDDYWTDPFKLQKQVDFLESHKDYSMTFHNIKLIDEKKEGVEISSFNTEKKSREYTYDEILKTWSVGTCSVLCINNKQYEYIEKNLWFPLQDMPLYLCCASMGKIYYMAETMSVYRRLSTGSQNSQEFKNPEKPLTFIKYYQVLYKDFNNIISQETINYLYASNYLAAAYRFKNIGQEKEYSQYMINAMSCNPKVVFEKEIKQKNESLQDCSNLKYKYDTLIKALSKASNLTLWKQPVKKIKAYIDLLVLYKFLEPSIIEDDKHILFTIKPTMKNVKVAFYLFKNNKRIDVQWYSEKLSYQLDKNEYGKGKYKIQYFVIDKKEENPGKAKRMETGYSKYVEI